MNWYIIININLFLTKLKDKLNSQLRAWRQKNIAIHKEFVGTHNIPTTYILILNEVSNHILLLSKFI